MVHTVCMSKLVLDVSIYMQHTTSADIFKCIFFVSGKGYLFLKMLTSHIKLKEMRHKTIICQKKVEHTQHNLKNHSNWGLPCLLF